MTRWVSVALCLVLALGVKPALADPVDEAQSVIRAQITAFLEDDAETAYSFASPGIRERPRISKPQSSSNPASVPPARLLRSPGNRRP